MAAYLRFLPLSLLPQGTVLDLSARGMQKLDPNFICSEDTRTLILDGNHIMKLDHLERSPGLQRLSVASNRLVRMMGVSRLTELRAMITMPCILSMEIICMTLCWP
uniref:Centrosomal protein 97 n=1 Tax=Mola mola TaxID=94237 RepID=A0A3Q3X5I1_MOLML